MMTLYCRCADTILSKKLPLDGDVICCDKNIFEERLIPFFSLWRILWLMNRVIRGNV